MAPPDVLVLEEAAVGAELAGIDQPEILVEVGLHLRDPLGDEPLRRDDQRPADQPRNFSSRRIRPGLDGLAEADLVGQQVTTRRPEIARAER